MSQVEPTDILEEDNQEENEQLDTQEVSGDEDMPFDLYIPFAVLLGEKKWDQLVPYESAPEKEVEPAQIFLPTSIFWFLLI